MFERDRYRPLDESLGIRCLPRDLDRNPRILLWFLCSARYSSDVVPVQNRVPRSKRLQEAARRDRQPLLLFPFNKTVSTALAASVGTSYVRAHV